MAKDMAKAEQTLETKHVVETITYVPGPMDPPHTKWGGHTFQANIPKEIKGHPDGTSAEQINHHIIESVRNGNPCFVLGDAAKRKREKAGPPKNAEEYRVHMIKWLTETEFESADQMIARLAQDRDLQARCEVGYDDFQYLSSLFMPKLSDLAKADGLSEGQVASLWLNHGYNQLPW